VDTSSDAANCGSCGIACGNGAACVDGVCSCSDELSLCGSDCVDLQNEHEYCGTCDNDCDFDLELCYDGSCACKPGFDACDEDCTNLATDPLNCGSCGNGCGQNFCANGSCEPDCTGFPDVCGQTCTDIQTDPQNCGVCGEQCNWDELCAAGECINYLPPFQTGCTECPCESGCTGEFTLCCEVDGYGVLCTDGEVCPQ
jgi:hypothetical protein